MIQSLKNMEPILWLTEVKKLEQLSRLLRLNLDKPVNLELLEDIPSISINLESPLNHLSKEMLFTILMPEL